METPKEYHYTYYSYEEWGRGYFGSRTCRCLPKEDVKYFGSFGDKTFKPTQKIILKDEEISHKMSKIGGYASLSYSSDTQSDEATSLMTQMSKLGSEISNKILFFDLFPARIIFGFKIIPVRSIL